MQMRSGFRGYTLAILLSAIGVTLLTSAGIAGPNRGAILLVHTDDAQDYSLGVDYSHLSGLECPDDIECPPYDESSCYNNACAINPTSHRGTDLTVFWVLTAVPPLEDDPDQVCPRIKGLTFGINYNEADLRIVDWGTTARVELQTDHWPGPNEGTAIVFPDTKLSPVAEVYWFAAYAYYETVLTLQGHPTQGGQLVDDRVPGNRDLIEGYGSIGFDGAEGTAVDCRFVLPVVDTSWGALKHGFR
ncbi:MAG: hypothetical protein R3E12_10605 [Candidatus Eisenbacteria bacterium]